MLRSKQFPPKPETDCLICLLKELGEEREYEGTKPRKEKQLPSILGEKINLDQVRSREELQNKTNLENSDANIKKEQSIENGQDPPEMTCL